MKRLLCLAALLSAGCWGEQKELGDAEIFRVHAQPGAPAAQFVRGPIPSAPAFTSMPDGGGLAGPPKVIEFRGPQTPVQGHGDVEYTGLTSKSSAALGLALEGISTGYWVLPVGGLNSEDLHEFAVRLDFDRAIPSSFYRLLSFAIDDAGNTGPHNATKICVASEVPDALSACVKTIKKVPEAVISLAWDSNVDLDLQVRTPGGVLVEPKHPNELPPNDAGVVSTTSAQIDRDSNANCVVDGTRREDLVWSAGNPPPHGIYTIYANLFDACKQASVRFNVTVYTKEAGYADGGDLHLVNATAPGFSGELLDFQANGGAAPGLFVVQVRL